MHTVSGRWKFGLFLSLVTAIMWGLLPIALKGLLVQMDAITVSWYRFASAGILVAIYLLAINKMPRWKQLKGKVGILCLIAVLALTINYVTYLFGLDLTTPSSAQVMIQTAPMMMLLGSLVIFKEQFSKIQWFGFSLFVIGLVLFFNLRLEEIIGSFNGYTLGLFWIFVAAVLWALYALIQKQLLNNFTSNQIMMMIYLASLPLLMPWSNLPQIVQLDTLGWLLLVFCCLNTLIAYGAFAESLAHWEASRVSAVIASAPLFTIFFMKIIEYLYPKYISSEPLNSISLIGAALVVIGSGITALSGNKKGA